MTQFGSAKLGRNPLTIALMILGFIFWWPLGLALLAYMLWGDHLHRTFDDMRGHVRDGARSMGADFAGFGGFQRSGNVAFDEFRERELKRLEEERRKLDAMRADFEEHLRNLHRARDQEEFDRFMSERRRGGGPAGDPAGAAA